MENLSNVARAVIRVAGELASDRGQRVVCPEHILYALLADDQYISVRVLTSLGVDIGAMRTQVEMSLDRCRASLAAGQVFSSEARSVLEAAVIEAGSFDQEQVGVQDLLVSLAKGGGDAVTSIFGQFGVEVDSLSERLNAFLHRPSGPGAVRLDLAAPRPADSPALASLIRELVETRAAKRRRIDEGDNDAALLLRAKEKGLLRDIAQLRASE